jgi:hypothetical protein
MISAVPVPIVANYSRRCCGNGGTVPEAERFKCNPVRVLRHRLESQIGQAERGACICTPNPNPIDLKQSI